MWDLKTKVGRRSHTTNTPTNRNRNWLSFYALIMTDFSHIKLKQLIMALALNLSRSDKATSIMRLIQNKQLFIG